MAVSHPRPISDASKGAAEKNPPIKVERLQEILHSHEIDIAQLEADDFEKFFDDRRERLLRLIETAMGRAAVREDVAPPDEDDLYDEDEQESELMELISKPGACRE